MKDKNRILWITILVFSALLYSDSIFGADPNPGSEAARAIDIFNSGDYIAARPLFQQLVKNNPKDDQVLYYLGRITQAAGKYEEAAEILEKATEMNKNRTEYFYWLGITHFSMLYDAGLFRIPGILRRGKEAVLQAVALDRKNWDARYVLIMFYGRAPGILGGDEDEALAIARETKRLDPKKGVIAFGAYYMSLEESEKAEKEIEEGLKRFPEDPELLKAMGTISMSLEKYDRALAIYEKLIQLTPDDMDVYYQIGEIGARTDKNLDRAEYCLNHFLQNFKMGRPFYMSRAHYRLGSIYRKLGNKDKAIYHFRETLKLHPDFGRAEDQIEELEEESSR